MSSTVERQWKICRFTMLETVFLSDYSYCNLVSICSYINDTFFRTLRKSLGIQTGMNLDAISMRLKGSLGYLFVTQSNYFFNLVRLCKIQQKWRRYLEVRLKEEMLEYHGGTAESKSVQPLSFLFEFPVFNLENVTWCEKHILEGVDLTKETSSY